MAATQPTYNQRLRVILMVCLYRFRSANLAGALVNCSTAHIYVQDRPRLALLVVDPRILPSRAARTHVGGLARQAYTTGMYAEHDASWYRSSLCHHLYKVSQ